MESSTIPNRGAEATAEMAFVGGCPAALAAAITLARRGIRSSMLSGTLIRLRANLASSRGIGIFDQAKSSETPYSEVRRKAGRLWPLWV
jgi:thioredoxin reductase